MIAELTQDQKKIYLAYLQEIKGEISKDINELGFDRSRIRILGFDKTKAAVLSSCIVYRKLHRWKW